MALKTKAEITALLIRSATRARQIREAAEKLKDALQTAEGQTETRSVNLIKPTLSPIVQR